MRSPDEIAGDGIDFTALVRDVLVQALGIDGATTDLAVDASLRDLPNMSSLAMLRGLMMIEDRLGVELEDNELVTARTIGELAAAIERHHEKSLAG
ncbi:acyl carrier protein [Streptomyces sp. NPDC056160]|uniref:acyl carrier protein n=1 Tax=Streptomyces sp. NPDC056160 TaxID=3345731 RepID=UPI0035E0BDB0